MRRGNAAVAVQIDASPATGLSVAGEVVVFL